MTPLLIFDLDGTLIDSAADLHAAINRLLAELDRPPLPLDQVTRMIGDGVAKLVERALAATSDGKPTDSAQATARFLALYEADPVRFTHAYAGVPETLRSLSDAGYRMAIATNKPERAAADILGHLGLASFFTAVLGGDSLPVRKPDPAMLTTLLDRFETIPARAILIGDSEVDMATAVAAGIPAILMTYGYRRGPVETIACAAALDRFKHIPETLLRLGLPADR
ncbi:MAG TPA: phosphoglycolate phosphatase [Stellaceae bacterium]|nr:phosphoglycolate phosphatase [Stellaceae bacterium]